jgi:invasion protein IalB
MPTTSWKPTMTKQRPRRSLGGSGLLAAVPVLSLLNFAIAAAHAQQPKPEGGLPSEKSAGAESAPRGQREAREIKYSDWSKTCFKTPGTNMVCRTSITGTFVTGQSAVRIDLIEREGDSAARLQLFLPVGLYLQAGAKITIDQGTPYQIPYVWCLTNTCIAADLAAPGLLKAMETGNTLLLEVVDSSVLTVSTSLSLDQFAAVRHGAPSRIFEQAIEE